MYKILLITGLVISLFISGSSFGQSWEKYLEPEWTWSIDGNGGYFTESRGGIHYDISFVHHFDRFGNRSLVSSDSAVYYSSQVIDSLGNLIIIYRNKGDNNIYYCLKLDSEGNEIWRKSIDRFFYLKTFDNSKKQIYSTYLNQVLLFDNDLNLIDTLNFDFRINFSRYYNGGYYIGGFDEIKNQNVIAEIKLDGSIIWQLYIDHESFNNYKITDAVRTINNNILVWYNRKVYRIGESLDILDEYQTVSGSSFHVFENSFWVYNDSITEYDFSGNMLRSISLPGGGEGLNFFDYNVEENYIFAECTTFVDNTTYNIFVRLDLNNIIGNKSIKGSLFIDANYNCLFENSETPKRNILIKKEPDLWYALTDSIGNYEFKVDSGESVTIKPVSNLGRFYSLDCFSERQVQINGDQDDSVGVDFPIHEELCPQLKLSYSRSTYNRCFPGNHKFYISNVGTETAHYVKAEIAFPNEIITKSVSEPYTIEDGVYNFNLSSLAPGEKIEIIFEDSVDCQVNTGFISGLAEVSTSSTCVLVENAGDSLNFGGRIRGSYDPNDKSVFPTRINFSDYTKGTRTADFHINFQNTGDGLAYKVVVVDTISADLDFEAISDIEASHSYTLQVLQTDPVVLAWSFVGINLPGKEENEPESHGFISFSMPLKENLSNNSVIENRAAIYFDFNDPIITNTASITISDEVNTDSGVITSTKSASTISQILIYPNPVNGSANIILPENISLPCTFALINNQGVKVREKVLSSRENLIQTAIFPTGLYHYQVSDGEKVIDGNLIVK